MVHSLFPHNHEDEPNCLPEVEEAAIIHILSHVFEQDLGIDHLETYVSSIHATIQGPSSEILLIKNDLCHKISAIESKRTDNLYINGYKPVEPISSGPPRSPPMA